MTLLNGKQHQKYSEVVRKFALTLRFHSPRAYQYIRFKFNNHLPSDSVIRSWYANSSANGEPGMSAEGMECISRIVQETQAQGKEFYCSLSFDEMSIRRKVSYSDSEKKFTGFVSYGHSEDAEDVPVARFALVFMANGVNVPVSFPICHEFIVSLNATKKADLLKHVVTEVSKLGAKILAVTFDGMNVNFTTCQRMGASFTKENFNPTIQNPLDNSDIQIILDPCHMIKLVRNCLHNEKIVVDHQKRKIEWAHFVALEECRPNMELVTHKIRKEHIDIEKKMKVILAEQLLSKSAANSFQFLRENGQTGFQNCAGTQQFCEIMNNLFDIFNTGYRDTLQSNNNNIYKTPISGHSAEEIFNFLDGAAEYIKQLSINDVNILKTRRHTGFLGILVNIYSLKKLYREFVVTTKMEFIPTFHLSQDPLESFFGRVRSECGYNSNPTVDQFKSAYRKILVNTEITSSHLSNCADNLNIFTVGSSGKRTCNQSRNAEEELLDIAPEPVNPNDILLNACKEATIVKLASEIENTISKASFKCSGCLNVLLENEKVSDDINVLKHVQDTPCISTVYICKVAEKFLSIFMKRANYDYMQLFISVINSVEYQHIYCNTDFSSHPTHEQFFVQHIVEEYIRRRSNYIAINKTLLEKEAKSKNQMRKFRHFQGI